MPRNIWMGVWCNSAVCWCHPTGDSYCMVLGGFNSGSSPSKFIAACRCIHVRMRLHRQWPCPFGTSVGHYSLLGCASDVWFGNGAMARVQALTSLPWQPAAAHMALGSLQLPWSAFVFTSVGQPASSGCRLPLWEPIPLIFPYWEARPWMERSVSLTLGLSILSVGHTEAGRLIWLLLFLPTDPAGSVQDLPCSEYYISWMSAALAC